jgi:hypothetical protein
MTPINSTINFSSTLKANISLNNMALREDFFKHISPEILSRKTDLLIFIMTEFFNLDNQIENIFLFNKDEN